jgi:ribosomal protein S20
MPIIKSAIKRAKQTITRRAKNVEIKKAIKSAEKAFVAKPSAETLQGVQSEYDKALKKGLMKKNTVSRRKASVYARAKASGVKLSATAKAKPVAKPATKPAAKKAAPKTAAKAK